MAVYNEILAGRFNRFVQKLLSMKGPTSLVAVASDLRFVHQVQSGVETRYLEGWDLFGVVQQMAAAGAGNNLAPRLRNPAGSGVIAVVTSIKLIDPTAATGGSGGIMVLARNATTDQNTIDTAQGWDQRGRPSSTVILSHNSAAGVGAGGSAVNIGLTTLGGANVGNELVSPNEIVLAPGTALTVTSNGSNTAMSAAWWWRERPLEDSEKF